MTCSACDMPGHNARGCHKFDKESGDGTSKRGNFKGKNKHPKKMDKISGEGSSKTRKFKGKTKENQTSKRQRRSTPVALVEDLTPAASVEDPHSTPTASVEDLTLTAPQPSQNSPPPTLPRNNHVLFGKSWAGPAPSDPDFEYPSFNNEEDLPWRPRGVSEFKSRLQQRQKQTLQAATRPISFQGDIRGLSRPSGLYAPKGLSWKGNASITGRQLEELRVNKLKTRKSNGKEQE